MLALRCLNSHMCAMSEVSTEFYLSQRGENHLEKDGTSGNYYWCLS